MSAAHSSYLIYFSGLNPRTHYRLRRFLQSTTTIETYPTELIRDLQALSLVFSGIANEEYSCIAKFNKANSRISHWCEELIGCKEAPQEAKTYLIF